MQRALGRGGLCHTVNRHPCTKALHLQGLASWKRAGGDLFAVFSSTGRYSKWGSWGVVEAHDQDPATAPQYQALIEFIAKNPTQQGSLLPTSLGSDEPNGLTVESPGQSDTAEPEERRLECRPGCACAKTPSPNGGAT